MKLLESLQRMSEGKSLVRFGGLHPDLGGGLAARDEFEYEQKRLQQKGSVTQLKSQCSQLYFHESFSTVALKLWGSEFNYNNFGIMVLHT